MTPSQRVSASTRSGAEARHREAVEQDAEDNSRAVGEHVPRREDAAQQQRARDGQPESIEPRGVNQPKQFHADGDRGRGRRDARSRPMAGEHRDQEEHHRAPQDRAAILHANGWQAEPEPKPAQRQTARDDAQAQASANGQCRAANRLSCGVHAGRSSATGMVSSKTVPCSESTRRIAPPWASSMARTIARPIPVPPLSRRVVKKLSKICARLLGETPPPLSATFTSSTSFCRIADSSSRELPWRGALAARLEKMMAAFSSVMRIGMSRSPLARRSRVAKAERRPAISPDNLVAPTAIGFSARAKSRRRPEIFASRSASAMMLSRNLRRSSSSIAGASTSSRSSSAAPWIEVSGDFSSCDTWVAKVEMKLERVFSRRAISRKLCDSRANSLVP